MFHPRYVGDTDFTDNIIYIAIQTQIHTKQYQIKQGVCVNIRPKGNVHRRAVCLDISLQFIMLRREKVAVLR